MEHPALAALLADLESLARLDATARVDTLAPEVRVVVAREVLDACLAYVRALRQLGASPAPSSTSTSST